MSESQNIEKNMEQMPESEDQGFDFNELDEAFDFDFDVGDFFGDQEETDVSTRLIKPPQFKPKLDHWRNAKKTADKIKVEPGFCYFGIIDGSFIFGDLIEALFTTKLLRAHRLDITTLSLSQENIDSLATLLLKGYVKELNLTVSDYFYAHERNTLIPYMHRELDIDNRFQLAVSGNHTKVVVAKLTKGIHLCIHGSANLRSSGNIEQIMLQDSKEIYDFITETNDRVIAKFKTINKSVRRAKLWHGVVEADEAVAGQAQPGAADKE